jgi:ABC-type sugar transport system permease subunit
MVDDTQSQVPETDVIVPDQKLQRNRINKVLYWILGIFAVLLILSIATVIFISSPDVGSGRVRDIFLILMALSSFVISVAFVILLVQIALLVNLLDNEIRPVLANLIESVNDLKGTTAFLSENMVEPVMKMNEYVAGLKRLVDILRPFRK